MTRVAGTGPRVGASWDAGDAGWGRRGASAYGDDSVLFRVLRHLGWDSLAILELLARQVELHTAG
ncbi:hypothetical protein AB0H86_00235 [Streptomyces sp. NPDC050997]|uniref:hypothetical protein n=1 Tax=Streptomyces sp. NPDC050997 TaxID=3155519 RepID=UPI00342C09EA